MNSDMSVFMVRMLTNLMLPRCEGPMNTDVSAIIAQP